MTLTARTPGSWSIGTTAHSVDMPSGAAAGDMLILFAGAKPYSATINTPSGWTRIGTQQTNGSTASGADSGSVTWSAFYKVAGAGESAVGLSITGGNTSLAVCHGYSKTKAEWVTPVMYHGSDTSSGTGYSITAAGSSGELTNEDALIHASVVAGNNAGFGSPTLTAASATIGAVTESPASEGNTALGDNLRGSCSTAAVTAGTASADAVGGWTLTASQTGGGGVIRLREVNTPITGTMGVTEGGLDTSTASGAVAVSGALTVTESGVDSVYVSSPTTVLYGTLGATDAVDGAAFGQEILVVENVVELNNTWSVDAAVAAAWTEEQFAPKGWAREVRSG